MKYSGLGIKDDDFIRGEIPMTKEEVRVLALVKARITGTDIVIDIGAGTGSLSVEAAKLASQGQVYAIEKEAEGVELIHANAARFLVPNIKVIHGMAPAKLMGLPQADVIFIGGSGGELRAILEQADQLLKSGGRLVIMAVTIETLQVALTVMQAKAYYQVAASGLQITRLRRAGAKNMFQALNPVYIITCQKN
ncbi:MAG: cbiT [Firmicutes bacterium]|nr:cbiT [Bacillota bacterium]